MYVDAYNLYFGGRRSCGRSVPGWRWLDVRALVEDTIKTQGSWTNFALERVVYCTARVDGTTNPSAQHDQDIYLRALRQSNSVDWIEYGNYVARTKRALLAGPDSTGAPVATRSAWPVMVRDSHGTDIPGAQFMVQYMHLEEKGSDVNVATHLLLDVLGSKVDAAVVISNDSDLELPVKEARKRVKVAMVNPYPKHAAGALKGHKADGVGGHWWWNLQQKVFLSNQLPPAVGSATIPPGW